MNSIVSPAPRFSAVDAMLLALVAIWGVNYSVIKSAISGPAAAFTPFAFNALRFAVAALILLPIALRLARRETFAARDLAALAGLGLVGNALYQVLFITGMSAASSANSALILASVPVIVALIGAATRTERLEPLAWVGVLLSVFGIAVVILGTGATAAGDSAGRAPAPISPFAGDLLVLASAVVWSAYTTLSAPLLRRYPSTLVTGISLCAGSVPLVIAGAPDLARLDWSAVAAPMWLATVFSGAFALALGYVAWNRGVKHLGGSRTAVYSNLTPVVAAAFAWLWRGEALTRYHWIATATILLGIQLTRHGRRAASVPLPAEE